MFESAGPFAESTEAFPLGTRMTLGKRKIRRKSRDAWCSTLKSLRAYGKMLFIGTMPSDLRQAAYRQAAYRQAAFYFNHWLEQTNQCAKLERWNGPICIKVSNYVSEEVDWYARSTI